MANASASSDRFQFRAHGDVRLFTSCTIGADGRLWVTIGGAKIAGMPSNSDLERHVLITQAIEFERDYILLNRTVPYTKLYAGAPANYGKHVVGKLHVHGTGLTSDVLWSKETRKVFDGFGKYERV